MNTHPPRRVSDAGQRRLSACARSERPPVPAAVAGFTLIEITIAVAMFAFLAFTTAEYYPLAGLNAQAGRNTSFAARFAQECIEDMKLKSFTYLTPVSGTANTLCLNTNQGGSVGTNQITASAANVVYTLTISATNCQGVASNPCNYPTASGNGNPSLTIVTVVVTWTEPASPGSLTTPLTRTYTVITMRHNFF